MSILDDFQRVHRQHPCPVCGKSDWCLVSRDDAHSPSRVLCTRVESSVRFGDAGWLHMLREVAPKSKRLFWRTTLRVCSRAEGTDFGSLSDRFRAALKETPLNGLAEQLGLTAESLERLGVGWASSRTLRAVHTQGRESGAWTFPMSEADGRVCGIRLRTHGGFKYSVTGSRQGLFIPRNHGAGKVLMVAEGPTDTAALLDLGFHAIGRPSCNTGFTQVRALIIKFKAARVVVVADDDEAGLGGANRLAVSLRPYCDDVRTITPPHGLKDVRSWKMNGASRADVVASIRGAEALGLKFNLCGNSGRTNNA